MLETKVCPKDFTTNGKRCSRKNNTHNAPLIITFFTHQLLKAHTSYWLKGVNNDKRITERLSEGTAGFPPGIKWAVNCHFDLQGVLQSENIRMMCTEGFSCARAGNTPNQWLTSVFDIVPSRSAAQIYCATPDCGGDLWIFSLHYSHSVCLQGTSQGAFKWVYAVNHCTANMFVKTQGTY